jgi:hypothetical protein
MQLALILWSMRSNITAVAGGAVNFWLIQCLFLLQMQEFILARPTFQLDSSSIYSSITSTSGRSKLIGSAVGQNTVS